MSVSSLESSSASSTCSCHNCGAEVVVHAVKPAVLQPLTETPNHDTALDETTLPIQAQQRITELEEQVKEYSLKAALAADRLERSQTEFIQLQRRSSKVAAEHERLLAFQAQHKPLPASPHYSEPASMIPARKLSSFLTRSASTSTPLVSRHLVPEVVNTKLEEQLSTERTQREEAESQLAAVKSELEELSASLFQQANEMVSVERKARMKLEERVAQLEKRDMEKGIRLERLEKALQRIHRVRGILVRGQTF